MKRDRLARLLRLQILLWQHPEGLELKNIAKTCSINIRTVYRDLNVLESELTVPIWQEGNKRGISEGYFLPPITFTPAEANIVFFSSRLLYNHLHLYNPALASTFLQLGSIVSPHLRKQIQNTTNHIEKLPRDERKANNFNKCLYAWFNQHSISIEYLKPLEKIPVKITIDPYFIEPNLSRHFSYIIGYCHTTRTIMYLRTDGLIGDVIVNNASSFTIPENFDINDYLSFGWGACDCKKVEAIKLKFQPTAKKSATNTIWHPSQKIDLQNDGSIIMTLKVQVTEDFFDWIVSQGCDVEVLEPLRLRQKMLKHMQTLNTIYLSGRHPEIEPPDTQILSHQESGLVLSKMNKLLKEEKIEIIKHKILDEGKSIRSVAKQMRLGRNTVTRYLKGYQPSLRVRRQKPRPVLDKIMLRLDELLKTGNQPSTRKKPTGSWIHQQLEKEGYRVGISTVRKYIREKESHSN